MPRLFERASLGSLELPNRFVRSATWEGLAEADGSVSTRLTELMAELARGEVGLIITGHAFVSPEGQSVIGQMAACDDRYLPGLAAMAAAVHAAGGRIALQLGHGGRLVRPELSGLEPVGPSALDRDGRLVCRELDAVGLVALADAFARAAGRARRAGFDAVQLHAAHGFLLNQFLSPAFNARRDDYGGSLENRARFLLETLKRVRDEVGPDFPVLVKLNSDDYLEGGLGREEYAQIAAWLEAASVDAIELSGGTVLSPQNRTPSRVGPVREPAQEAYHREAARFFKERLRIPLILVGGVRSFEVAEALVREDVADFIALSRPLVCEPGLIRRWRAGDRRPSACLSDNACSASAKAGRGLSCVTLAGRRDRSDA